MKKIQAMGTVAWLNDNDYADLLRRFRPGRFNKKGIMQGRPCLCERYFTEDSTCGVCPLEAFATRRVRGCRALLEALDLTPIALELGRDTLSYHKDQQLAQQERQAIYEFLLSLPDAEAIL